MKKILDITMIREKQLDDINFFNKCSRQEDKCLLFELHNFNTSSFNILGRKVGV